MPHNIDVLVMWACSPEPPRVKGTKLMRIDALWPVWSMRTELQVGRQDPPQASATCIGLAGICRTAGCSEGALPAGLGRCGRSRQTAQQLRVLVDGKRPGTHYAGPLDEWDEPARGQSVAAFLHLSGAAHVAFDRSLA
jgi:hypothetical protein